MLDGGQKGGQGEVTIKYKMEDRREATIGDRREVSVDNRREVSKDNRREVSKDRREDGMEDAMRDRTEARREVSKEDIWGDGMRTQQGREERTGRGIGGSLPLGVKRQDSTEDRMSLSLKVNQTF